MTGHSWLPSLWGEQKAGADPFRALKTQMDELFNDWTSGFGRLGLDGDANSLRVDVSETPTEIMVKADLPGVDQKDIDITVSGNQLTIKAEKKSEHEEKKDDKGRVYHRVERSYGAYQRTMSLPFDVDPAKVTAGFKDGVLALTLPKPPEAQKQTRRIEVKSAA